MTSHDLWIILTGALVAGSCGFIGSFLVLRRMAMLGDAISHSVLLGIVLAFLLTHRTGVLPMFGGAAAIGLLTAFIVQLFHDRGVQEDAAIGVTFTSLFALGVVLLSLYGGKVHFDLEHVLYGEIAYVPWDTVEWAGRSLGPRAVWVVGGVFALSLIVTALFYKEFKLCAFDPALAATLGIKVALMHYLQMALVSMTAVAAFESVGAVLTVAMLIVPGATAYLLTERLGRMLALSVAGGVLSAAGGYGLAVVLDSSIGGAMTAVAGLLFAAAFLFSPRHGVLARRLPHARLTRQPFPAGGEGAPASARSGPVI